MVEGFGLMENMENVKKASQYSPLVLAYIGDAVYEVYVRARVIEEHPDMPAYKLHRLTVQYVKAHAQSDSVFFLENTLSEKELAVYKRGRNAKSATVPKNADLTEYRRATGFEALVGYLYLEKKKDRLNEIMELAYNAACKKQDC